MVTFFMVIQSAWKQVGTRYIKDEKKRFEMEWEILKKPKLRQYQFNCVFIMRSFLLDTAIGNNYFVKRVKEHMVRLFIFLLSLSLFLNTGAANASVSFKQGQKHNESVISENLLKVNLFYYKDFPYRQSYVNQEIKGCIKMPARGIVHCKEFISLIRSKNKVNNWLRVQHEKGYMPLTRQEFGISNSQGHINKVAPVYFSSINKKLGNVSSLYMPATGIFIRHVPAVREYTFKNIKTNVVFSVKATPEHPVYAANRQGFIPISQLLPGDHLLSENGQKIELICPQGVNNGCGVSFNQGGITVVYNIETSQRHTYFVQSEKLLVHNCNNDMYKSKMNEETGEKTDAPKSDKNHYPNHGRVRLVMRSQPNKNFLSKTEYTMEEAREFRNEVRSRSSSRYSRINVLDIDGNTPKNGLKVRALAVIDSEGSVAPYSSLDDLSLYKGRLLNNSMPVTKNLSSFNFTKEIITQGAINVGYHTMQVVGGALIVVGGMVAVLGLLTYGVMSDMSYCGFYNGYCF